MDIPLHAEVICTDGSFGKTSAVVLKPATDQVTHVVVSESGLLGSSVLVPVDYISESTPDQVRVRLSRDQLEALEPFAETDTVPMGYSVATSEMGYPYGAAFWPATGDIDQFITHRSVPRGEVTLHHGDSVEAADGHVGRVDELLIDPQNDEITHLIMREGHLWDKRDITIGVEDIDHIEEHIVYLKLTKQQIEMLPERPVAPKE